MGNSYVRVVYGGLGKREGNNPGGRQMTNVIVKLKVLFWPLIGTMEAQ